MKITGWIGFFGGQLGYGQCGFMVDRLSVERALCKRQSVWQQALASGDYLGLTATGSGQLHDFGGSRWGQVFKIR